MVLHRVVFVVGELGVALGGIRRAFRVWSVVLTHDSQAVGRKLVELSAPGGAGEVAIGGAKLLFERGKPGVGGLSLLVGECHGGTCKSGGDGKAEDARVLGCCLDGCVDVQSSGRHGVEVGV